MQKAKQLGLCDDSVPSSAADSVPKKRSREKGAAGGGDGMRQLAIDGGVVVESKAPRLYKPKPGSAQEAVLRTLMAAEEQSEDGLLRDDMLQRAQQFTGLLPSDFGPVLSFLLTGITLQNEPEVWRSIKSSLIEKGEKCILYSLRLVNSFLHLPFLTFYSLYPLICNKKGYISQIGRVNARFRLTPAGIEVAQVPYPLHFCRMVPLTESSV